MRVSEFYHLNRSQPTLSFVDVDITTDVPAFIDPTAIRMQDTDWSHTCQALLQSFFAEVLECAADHDDSRAARLMGPLAEPNETHLGFSKGKSRGRGLGAGAAYRFFEAIRSSAAARSRQLSDLEDTRLLIEGIGPDLVSDITTNVIRGALIGYTQAACNYYGIDTELQYSGHVWNPDALEWQEGEEYLPRPDESTLLLVPKSIIRIDLTINSDKYYNGFIAPRLEGLEIDSKSKLVTILKDGRPKVRREDLKKKYPATKLAIVEYTDRFPEALSGYKKSLSALSSPPLSHEDLHDRIGTPEPDYQLLLDEMLTIPAGDVSATVYHRACEKLITALFDPHLGNMQLEDEIHEGRKRIDISYDNLSPRGTFFWLKSNFHCAVVPVECKNYSRDVANPELDQISGRFSDRRGFFGIITFRSCTNKDLFLRRCKDTAIDGRGYIVALDDGDFKDLVAERIRLKDAKLAEKALYKLIRERIDFLIT